MIERIRGELTQELGRVPTPKEMTANLSTLITNPDIRIGGYQTIQSATQSKENARCVRNHVDPHELKPERRAMEREVMQLAACKLCAEDRTMLKWILRGKSSAQIARDLKMSNAGADQRLTLDFALPCGSGGVSRGGSGGHYSTQRK